MVGTPVLRRTVSKEKAHYGRGRHKKARELWDVDAKDFCVAWLLYLGESSGMWPWSLHPPRFLSAAASSMTKWRLKTVI